MLSSAYVGSTLVPMSDAELSATRGQALMSMSYIAPTDSANLENYVTIAVILVL